LHCGFEIRNQQLTTQTQRIEINRTTTRLQEQQTIEQEEQTGGRLVD
jgi:hypothetical protein